MADEHPRIAERDWRLRAITTLTEEHHSPSGTTYPVGSLVELVGFVFLPNGRGLTIPFPDPTAIFLSLAEKELRKATEYQDTALPSGVNYGNDEENTLKPGIESGFFDCLQSIVAAVVFSYTAIEVFANSMIPDDYVFSNPRRDKKCTESYSKDQIERHISLDTKLDKLLPDICNVASPKGTKLWVQYVKIKDLRDRLIHLKSRDWQKSVPANAKNSIWTRVLSEETRHVPAFAFELIWHYLPAKKPRWAERFREIGVTVLEPGTWTDTDFPGRAGP